MIHKENTVHRRKAQHTVFSFVFSRLFRAQSAVLPHAKAPYCDVTFFHPCANMHFLRYGKKRRTFSQVPLLFFCQFLDRLKKL